MKGDFSKQTFHPEKHFHDVLTQQGRVFLDQDWNEHTGITGYRSETTSKDIIGISGAPMNNGGFKIESFVASPLTSPASGDLNISSGHFYVDGILCENEKDTLFENQPDFPGQALPADPGNYLLYLDVWLRHITVIEDNSLREVALGGPDTTTRTKVIWQVKYSQIGDTSPLTPLSCSGTDLPAETRASAGTLSARSEPTQNTDDPCGIAATGGYRRLQNQLYRVEIHKGSGADGGPTYKWSRDNGSIIVSWQDYDPTKPAELKVSSLGKDELSGFNSGDWIEIIDDTTDLLIQPGILARISKPPQNDIITIDISTIIFPDPTTSTISFVDKINPRIRRWDSFGDLPLNANTWVDLEDGVQVMLSGDLLKPADYWTIPARTAIADVEWPKDAGNTPIPSLPFGIEHHYAKLAIANFDATNGWSVISDCRNLFPSLTELTSLYYVGGDGQEATPGVALPEPLMVGVANGSWAVSNAKVQFKILQGAGSLDPADGLVTTGADGIASCKWTPDSNTSDAGLQVSATLLDDTGNPVQVVDNNGNIIQQKLPVIFSAGFGSESSSTDACCSIPVGPNEKYKTLVQAIIEISKLKQENTNLDVSLCLLPGNHTIDENIDMSQMNFNTLHISGPAAYVSMNTALVSLVAVSKIVLEGFSLQTTPADQNQVSNPQIIIITSAEISIDHCSFIRNGVNAGQAGVPFVYLIGGLAYITNSVFLGFFSLVLQDGIQGIVEKNTITILVIQNESFDLFNNFSFSSWTLGSSTNPTEFPGTKTFIRGTQFNITTWVLNIRNNHLGEITTIGSKIVDPQLPNAPVFLPKNIYQSVFISENIFQLPIGTPFVNSIFAQFATITNNQFLYNFDIGPGPHAFIPSFPIAFILAGRATIIGNVQGTYWQTYIDLLITPVVDSIDTHNVLGVDPRLNLVGVLTDDSFPS